MRRAAASLANSAAALLALATVVAGCASSNPPPKPTPLSDIKGSLDVRVTWRTSVGSGRGTFLQPAVAENAIYAANADGGLVRVDPQTGGVVWRASVDGPIAAGVGSDGFTVVVATPRGEVIAFGADGKSLWRAQATSDVISPPLVGRGLVIVRSTDHRISAYEAESGKRRWTYLRQTPPLTLRTSNEMVFSGDNVLVGFPGGRLVALALSNGAARWEAVVSEPKGTTEVERLGDVVGPVAADARDACAASFQGRVMCANPANGNLRWARELSARTGVALGERALYAVDSGSNLQAFARDGASLWRNIKLAYRDLTAPLALRDGAVVGDLAGYVHFLGNDGEFVARMQIDSSPVVARPQRWADGVIVLTQDGTLALLTPQR
ncbi:MAG: outer membrane protein assembly factor BamB [Gemmatimonadota bacterium]